MKIIVIIEYIDFYNILKIRKHRDHHLFFYAQKFVPVKIYAQKFVPVNFEIQNNIFQNISK